MTILKADGLTKKYNSFYAVDNISMNIHEGDIYGFVGENGAGKTTFIRLISGLIQKSEGEFSLFEGEDYHIGAVVETPSLYLNLSAMDNLMMQAKIIGNIDVERHKELLRLVRLEYLIDTKKKAKDYSLGMKQRLGIAMSLLMEPKFLLLDEPMNGLDPEGIVLMRNLILTLNEQGITFLISSHMLSELSKVATRYGFIHKGRLIHEVTKEELYEKAKDFTELNVGATNVGRAKDILEGLHLRIETTKSTVKILDDVSISDIIVELSKQGISVKGVHQETDNIENYYLQIIGGKHD